MPKSTFSHYLRYKTPVCIYFHAQKILSNYTVCFPQQYEAFSTFLSIDEGKKWGHIYANNHANANKGMLYVNVTSFHLYITLKDPCSVYSVNERRWPHHPPFSTPVFSFIQFHSLFTFTHFLPPSLPLFHLYVPPSFFSAPLLVATPPAALPASSHSGGVTP